MTNDPDVQVSLKPCNDVPDAFDDVVTEHHALRERLFLATVELDRGNRTSIGDAFESVYSEHPALNNRPR